MPQRRPAQLGSAARSWLPIVIAVAATGLGGLPARASLAGPGLTGPGPAASSARVATRPGPAASVAAAMAGRKRCGTTTATGPAVAARPTSPNPPSRPTGAARTGPWPPSPTPPLASRSTTPANGGCTSYLCTAGSGYDGPTGLGTPNSTTAFHTGRYGALTGTVTDTAHSPVPGRGYGLAPSTPSPTDTADTPWSYHPATTSSP